MENNSDTGSFEGFTHISFIAEGGYGVVEKYLSPTGEFVAVKSERALSRITRSMLEYEYKLYQVFKGHPCIPRVYAYDTETLYGPQFRVMVMELLGPTVGNRFRQSRDEFSVERVARVGLGMLTAVEYIHSKGFIHRDLKPENFLFGRDDQPNRDTVHIIDFGLARRYRDRDTNVHFAPAKGTVMGTLIYSSPGAHLGQGGTEKHRSKRIEQKKRSWTTARLCQGLPQEVERFMSYCFSLEWSQDPDYDFLRSQLSAIAGSDTTYNWSEESKECYMTFNWLWGEEDEAETEETKPVSLSSKEAHDSTDHPSVRQGDLIFARVLCKETLEYEPKIRNPDPSYYHRTGDTEEFPFRQPFDLFVYDILPHRVFLTQKTASITSFRYNLPDPILSEIEQQINAAKLPHDRKVYESDDNETSTLVKNLPNVESRRQVVLEISPFESPPDDGPVVWDGFLGWSVDVGVVEQKWKEENGELSDFLNDVTMSELRWTGPFPDNLPLSCEL
ncbi:kinase-like domain-containing protein [Rhodocollybia butyracea]|uniref:non-specific serine/threonine protein kinase n=1 Tax=Rhodocollybia butyracea TaxID=206335 RepID=A0A9P5PX63_9AGAR|nr:kinase-like domain-containing protein [Rhodocollybia butyracea]